MQAGVALSDMEGGGKSGGSERDGRKEVQVGWTDDGFLFRHLFHTHVLQMLILGPGKAFWVPF